MGGVEPGDEATMHAGSLWVEWSLHGDEATMHANIVDWP